MIVVDRRGQCGEALESKIGWVEYENIWKENVKDFTGEAESGIGVTIRSVPALTDRSDCPSCKDVMSIDEDGGATETRMHVYHLAATDQTCDSLASARTSGDLIDLVGKES